MVAMVVGGRDWRYWLVEIPARITDVGMTWYRLWFMFTLWVAAIVSAGAMVTLIAMLVLEFGFGIRWGW